MSSCDRRAVLAGLAILPLAGCFRPMLAEDGPASAVLGRIALPTVDDRFGYFLNRSLEGRLGRATAPDWRLEVNTRITERGFAVAQDNSVTRITLEAEATWKLFRAGETRPVLTDRAVTQSGYGATSSLFATRQTRRDIERRLANDLGERISRAILARAELLAS